MDRLHLQFCFEISKVVNLDASGDLQVRKSNYRTLDFTLINKGQGLLKPMYNDKPFESLFESEFIFKFFSLESTCCLCDCSNRDFILLSGVYYFVSKYLRLTQDWRTVVEKSFEKLTSITGYDSYAYEFDDCSYFCRLYIIPQFTRKEYDDYISEY